jgi:aspartate aminotransferase
MATTPTAQKILTDRIGRIEVSATMAVTAEAAKLRAQGAKLVDFGAGEPHFATPRHIKDAAIAAIEANFTRYTIVSGIPEVRKAIVERHACDFGSDYAPDEAVFTTGGKLALFNALQVLVEHGDEVILPVPYWVSYKDIIQYGGGVPVYLETEEAENFRITAEAVEGLITPRTKAIILNSPSNPAGSVIAPADLERIVQLAHERSIYLILDECYVYLQYNGALVSGGSFLDAKEHVIVAGSLSKTYAMTGWRVGFCGGPARLIAAMAKVQGQATGGVSGIAQAAAVAALSGPQDIVAEMRDAYAGRSRAVASLLAGIAGVRCVKPAGAFYVFPDFSALLPCRSPAGRSIATDADLADALLTEAYVATVHGGAFGMAGHLRLSTAASPAALETACRRIAAFFAAAR